MDKSKSVAQFMDALFQETLGEKRGGVRQTVQFIVQSARTDNRTLAVKARQTENESQHRDVQIPRGKGQQLCTRFPCFALPEVIFQPLEWRRS